MPTLFERSSFYLVTQGTLNQSYKKTIQQIREFHHIYRFLPPTFQV